MRDTGSPSASRWTTSVVGVGSTIATYPGAVGSRFRSATLPARLLSTVLAPA